MNCYLDIQGLLPHQYSPSVHELVASGGTEGGSGGVDLIHSSNGMISSASATGGTSRDFKHVFDLIDEQVRMSTYVINVSTNVASTYVQELYAVVKDRVLNLVSAY